MNHVRLLTAATASPIEGDATEIEGRLLSLALDGQGPVWLQVRRAIARKIISGAWRPGSRVPAEISMALRFGASRMTVAKAIQTLAKEGLVERHRKIGTVVAARAQERPVFEIWDVADIVVKMGKAYSYKLLSCAFVGDDLETRTLFGVGRGAQILRMRCLHLADGAPFQLEERLVNVDAAPGITCQPLETVGPSPWLLANVPWSEAEHTVSAVEATADVAEALGVREGAACLLVERQTWNDSLTVTSARLWHLGDTHRLTGRFKPGQ